MLDNIMLGLSGLFTPVNIIAMLLSVPLGIIIGALPGFGAATGLIIVLPMTYTLGPAVALVSMAGVYVGAEYGGSISSILINTPGTGGAVVTCFDGFPMAKKGKARDALLISNISSFTGGIIGGLIMLFFLPILGNVALQIGAGEIFMLAVIGLLLVGSISQGEAVKGVASAAFGVLLTTVGADITTGHPRFDFGNQLLFGGLPFIPVMLGIFSIPYILNLVLAPKRSDEVIQFEKLTFGENLKTFFYYFKFLHLRYLWLIVYTAIIGVIIGIIPGVGGSTATIVAYTTAKKVSKHPEEYGTGCVEGIVAPESCNNGLVGGALIPLLSLGIPGSPAAAVFMGAIFMHGLAPGPNFMLKQAPLVYTLTMAVLITPFIQILLGAFTIGSLAKVLRISMFKLVPALIAICCIGAYVVRGLDFDVLLFCFLGLTAFLLMRLGFNLAAIVLGMVLGGITEVSLMEAMTIASAKDGLVLFFWRRPIAMVLFAVLVLYVGYSVTSSFIGRKQRETPGEATGPAEKSLTWQGMRMYDAILMPIFFIGCAVLYRMTLGFPGRSALFPRFVLIILMASLLYVFVRSLFLGRAYLGRETPPFADVHWGRFGITVFILAAYLVLINVLGFFTASLLFVFAASMYFYSTERPGDVSMRTYLSNGVYSLCFTVCIYLVFEVLFQVDLPSNIVP